MKHKIAFIKEAVLFVLALIIILILLNQIYIQLIIPQKNIYRSQYQYLNALENDPQIMFFGDSHPAYDINPGFLNNSFNYALPGETYEQTFYKIRKVLNDVPSVEIFVLPFDLHSFSDYRINPYNDIRYWQSFLSSNELKRASNLSSFNLFLNKYFPLIGNGDEILGLFLDEQRTEMISGWQKMKKNFTSSHNLNLITEQRINDQFKNYPNIINPKLFLAFINSIKMVKEHNKTLVIVQYPVTLNYLSSLNSKGINSNKFYAYTGPLLSKYGNITILDYQKIFKDNLIFFSDSDHLNYLGAEVFSKEINNELKNLSFKK